MQFLPGYRPPAVKLRLPTSFQGTNYRLADNWFSRIPVDASKPIRYAEVGAFYGANILSVEMSYGAHPDSELIAIDPWTDYEDYPEYKGEQTSIYDAFCHNTAPYANKIKARRGYSHEILPTLEDGAYDIIYIDGNHEPDYVLEDAVLAFRKLKVGGHLIFDDYGWGGPDLTKRGIDAFLHGYTTRVRNLGTFDTQLFAQKLR
jgi:hypothetical protein